MWRQLRDTSGVSLVPLSQELSQAQAAIAGLGLHVLVFGDVGMEALTTYLSYARLAPVQVAFWGHPSTTGTHTLRRARRTCISSREGAACSWHPVPLFVVCVCSFSASSAVDYYITSELFEDDSWAAQGRFSEQLVRFSSLSTFFGPANASVPMPSPQGQHVQLRAGLDPQDKHHFYVCAQMLQKLHPSFDEAIKVGNDKVAERTVKDHNSPSWTLSGCRGSWPKTKLPSWSCSGIRIGLCGKGAWRSV